MTSSDCIRVIFSISSSRVQQAFDKARDKNGGFHSLRESKLREGAGIHLIWHWLSIKPRTHKIERNH